MGDWFGERLGKTERQVAPERVAVPGRIFRRHQPRLTTQLHLDRPTRSNEIVDPRRRTVRRSARRSLPW